MKLFFYTCLAFALLSSCAFHSGSISSGPLVECPLRYTVSGTANTHIFFGIGGLSKDALIMEAKKNLRIKYPYKIQEKITNYSVDFKTTFFLFFIGRKATVSADLYDCSYPAAIVPGATSDTSPDLQSTRPDTLVPAIDGFRKDNNILYNRIFYLKGTFLQHQADGRYLIRYEKRNGSWKTTKAESERVFNTTRHPDNKAFYGFEIGEEATIEVENTKTNTKTRKVCTIVGINTTSAIISYIKDDGTNRYLTVKKTLIKK